MNDTIKRSTFLFDMPSFVKGMARVFDLGGSLNEYNISSSPDEADLRALRADWAATGDDLVKAYRTVLAERGLNCVPSES